MHAVRANQSYFSRNTKGIIRISCWNSRNPVSLSLSRLPSDFRNAVNTFTEAEGAAGFER